MADEESIVVGLRNDFYRDRIGSAFFLLIGMLGVIGSLMYLSHYLHSTEPPPVNFNTYQGWRVQGDIPITEPYLSEPEVLQFVSNIMRQVFVFDFYHFEQQFENYPRYFTKSGWEAFSKQIEDKINQKKFKREKLFSNSTPTGAPYILNQGILSGRYAWWVQAPLKINLLGGEGGGFTLNLQVLVVRVSTLGNLAGILIENVKIASDKDLQRQ